MSGVAVYKWENTTPEMLSNSLKASYILHDVCEHMLCSVPSECKTRRELGCDPVRCNASQPPLRDYKGDAFPGEAHLSEDHYPEIATRGRSETCHQEDTGSPGAFLFRPFVVIVSFFDVFYYPCIPSPSTPRTPYSPPLITSFPMLTIFSS